MTSDEDNDPTADLALVRAFLQHPRQQAAALMARFLILGRMLAYLNNRRGRPLDHHQLDDLVQEVTTLALGKLDEYAGRGPFDAWLHKLALHSLRNRIRQIQRHRRREAKAELDELPAPSNQTGDNERVDRLLARVGGSEAEIIRMRCLEDLEFPDIARLLDLSVTNVKSRFYRGIGRLRAQ